MLVMIVDWLLNMLVCYIIYKNNFLNNTLIQDGGKEK